MRAVLLDGTTLMAVSQLLSGDRPPTALSVSALALLAESLILHEKVVVLDTLEDDDRLNLVANDFGPFLRVERRTVPEIVAAYLEMEYPELAGLGALTDDEMDRFVLDRRKQRMLKPATEHLRSVLEGDHDDYDDCEEPRHDDNDASTYFSFLYKAHNEQRSPLVDEVNRVRNARMVSSKAFFDTLGMNVVGAVAVPFMQPSQARPVSNIPSQDGTELGQLTGDYDSVRAWDRFVENYTTLGSSSAWHAGDSIRAQERHRFSNALLVRTHLYLIASEVFGVPYRPDLIKGPICWKFFEKGSFLDFAAEERFVDAAERMVHEQARSINEFLGRAAFVEIPLSCLECCRSVGPHRTLSNRFFRSDHHRRPYGSGSIWPNWPRSRPRAICGRTRRSSVTTPTP